MKKINDLTTELFGSLVNESDIELIQIFFQNVLAARVKREFQSTYGNDDPTFGKLSSILAKTGLNDHVRSKIIHRVQYWINQQSEQNWTDDLGFERSRKPPKSKQRDGVCSWPGCENKGRMELDHMFPYSLGGDSGEDNFQTLCRSCNLAKGNSIFFINRWPTD